MKSVFTILTFCFLISSEIKEESMNAIKSFYNDDIEIIGKIFSISKEIKNEIQNKVKQKFSTSSNGNNSGFVKNSHCLYME